MAFPDIKVKNNYLNQSIFNKARVDKFLLVLTFPEALRNIDKKYGAGVTPSKIVGERLELSVWGIVVPTISVGSVDVPFQNQTPVITNFTRPAYDPVNVKFTIDSEFYNWYVIWQWLALINNPGTSNFDEFNISGMKAQDGKLVAGPGKAEFWKNYTSEIQIKALNEYNQIIGNFTYTNCFPTGLDGIDFTYQGSDEIVSGFTFRFNQLFFNINT